MVTSCAAPGVGTRIVLSKASPTRPRRKIVREIPTPIRCMAGEDNPLLAPARDLADLNAGWIAAMQLRDGPYADHDGGRGVALGHLPVHQTSSGSMPTSRPSCGGMNLFTAWATSRGRGR